MSDTTQIQKADKPKHLQAVQDAKKSFVQQYGEEKAREVFAREAGFAMMAMQNNDSVAKCNPDSIRQAVACVALTGISLNPTTKLSYLIPRKGRAVLDISYMGMIEILRNSGSIKSMSAAVVYEGEDFDYELGSNAYLKHKPSPSIPANTPRLGAYAVATMPDGSTEFYFMRWQDIMKRKEVSAAGNSGPWAAWPDEMAMKTVIRTFYKFLPKTPQATQAMQLFDEAQNAQAIDIETESEDL
jgi:recombination protein RecT